MSPAELEQYLHRHIPISRAMEVSVVALHRDCVELSAPLEPNINHRETVFGGSATAVAVLAAWALVHTRLIADELPSRLVIQHNTMTFAAPITGRFSARSSLAEDADWERFLRTIRRRGTARIRATCDLEFDGAAAGRFDGRFVALR